MKFNYTVNEVPPVSITILNGLQWFVLLMPFVVMVGKTVGITFLLNPSEEILYIQKLSFIVFLSLTFQIFFGHALPILSGPATILLVGLIASKSYNESTLYTALLVGSCFVCLMGMLNITKKLITYFTKNIIAVVLILIAFTMLPTIVNMILKPIGLPQGINLIVALAIIMVLYILEKVLRGFWKSSLILWAMIIGSLIYALIFDSVDSVNEGHSIVISNYFKDFLPAFDFDLGLVLTFIVCYIALVINDIGSMQSVSSFVGVENSWRRIKRGVFVTGFVNFIASLMGTIGVVNFSFSPGVILITKCASKYVLLLTALLMLILSFFPYFLDFINIVPHLLVGAIFFYVMASQISTGFTMLYAKGEFKYTDGIVVGFPVMLGAIIANLPAEVINTLPNPLKPFLGNGFVMGILFAIILEHLIYRNK
jgi:xanthine/uracil permease